VLVRAVVFDLDGVVLHYDPARLAAISADHGVAAEDLTRAAFAPDVLPRLTTGALTHADWIRHVGEAVGSPDAAALWLDGTADTDPEILVLLAELRAHGVRTGILTNGTDRTVSLLERTPIPEAVDRVVCTADLGVAKPAARAYLTVCERLGVPPHETFFTDDTAANIEGARRAGLTALLFDDVAVLRSELVAHGLLPPRPAGTPTLRAVTLADRVDIHRIARRMRRTLQEVVDPVRGAELYDLPWLEDRVRQHLDPDRLDGGVWLAMLDGASVGHTIVRAEADDDGVHGLFSTTWVAPDTRRAGVASQLLTHGERWMRDRGLPRAATHTAADNAPLIRLYERHGYTIVLRSGDMVRLERSLTAGPASRPPR
jgi:putative hydrolase of the HAD superfamily